MSNLAPMTFIRKANEGFRTVSFGTRYIFAAALAKGSEQTKGFEHQTPEKFVAEIILNGFSDEGVMKGVSNG